ncbi:metallophosphoesterase [Halobaculum sp. MBLA0143]|uniref:metallophosphoesterase n=1 Tax=Halobaculum sp. MBLA0143 TaxID=3079933 RepID=UPI003523FAB0
MRDAVFRDRAVYFARGDTLVLADLHVGRGEAADVEFPLGEATDLRERLSGLLAAFDPETVVVAGDVLHQFSRTSDAVARSLSDLREACLDAGARPVLVAGNHDAMLSSVWDGPTPDSHEIELSDESPDGPADDFLPETVPGPVVVRHGHETPPAAEADRAGLYVVGHDHPTVEIQGKRRPCYLFVPDAIQGTPALMLPAFNRIPAGVVVNGMSGADFQSPFVTAANPVHPVVWDSEADERLSFPRLGELRQLL